MKNFFFEIIFILVVGAVAQLFLPWWVIMAVAGVAGLLFAFKNSLYGFIAGFLAVSLLWGGYAGILDTANLSVLSAKMGDLFQGLDGKQMVYLTALLGGILGGFSAMTGNLARNIFAKEQ